MLKNIIILLLLTSSYMFAIKDKMLRRETILPRILYSASETLPEPLSSSIGEDEKNVYLYKGHFRVIFGTSYKDSASINSLASSILDIADYVWSKEIDEYGFKEPIHSSDYYIDIYIGNKSAYNFEDNSYVAISGSYAGYATSYLDGTPYFVINPSINIDILKVTIAHEFFHTIQYAYGLLNVSDGVWDKDIWFLEASAVMMEDEVYGTVNDYINYLKSYLQDTQGDIEYHNGSIEYGKVLFAKYLKERYGMDFIKELLSGYKISETFLENIKELFAKKGYDFDRFLLDYAKAVASGDFKDGSLFPAPSYHSIDENISVGNCGFLLFDKGANSYLNSSNISYLQSTLNGKENSIEDIDSSGLIFVNPRARSIRTDITKNNIYNSIPVKIGWNMLSNITDANLSIESIFSGDEVIWVYRENRYFAYSPNSDIENLIKEKEYSFDNTIYPGESFWVYSSDEKYIDLPSTTLHAFALPLKNGWNFISPSSSSFDLNDINEDITVWNYKDNSWAAYQKDDNLTDFKTFHITTPYSGYFIYKR